MIHQWSSHSSSITFAGTSVYKIGFNVNNRRKQTFQMCADEQNCKYFQNTESFRLSLAPLSSGTMFFFQVQTLLNSFYRFFLVQESYHTQYTRPEFWLFPFKSWLKQRCRNSGRLNFVHWRLIFASPQYSFCSVPRFWRLEFWGGS